MRQVVHHKEAASITRKIDPVVSVSQHDRTEGLARLHRADLLGYSRGGGGIGGGWEWLGVAGEEDAAVFADDAFRDGEAEVVSKEDLNV